MLRVISLNLNYRVAKHGAWPSRRQAIVHAARERRADVMALQAVEAPSGANQAQELAALLGFEHVAFIAAEAQHGVARGSAFISRYPLAHVDARELSRRPGHEDTSRRVLVHTDVETDVERVRLYNAHFSWVREQALDNAREAVRFHDRGPALLLGDLNNSPEAPALAVLRQAGWVDLWAAMRAADPGYTFEADRPSQRIDYALASGSARAYVRSIERVDGGADGRRLSDHLGLLVTLSRPERVH